ncbi:FG-GAP repeat domain-containing protein [Pseudozobellia thermophila]|uniref:Repeat domain-containing protein n=1 Tax=Pseudozobellia thermophila TaxID=192903 RepID=A0A1M6NMK0_9FLAO|nr:VCBS repeat-containing protein [Pseudozobellia thermophila]SHJ96816.1 Repeat domain-containing protein [Pseudozobellia thermophila]
MKAYSVRFWVMAALFLAACKNQQPVEKAKSLPIGEEMFDHHYISRDMPGNADWGYGGSVSSDFDNDGDPDYAVSCAEGFFWFENADNDSLWASHKIGELAIRHLGAATFDVDNDGWSDVIIGNTWYRNTHSPREEEFEPYVFDEAIDSNIHDIVMVDIDGDGKEEMVLTGEGEGVFWYEIPENPTETANWEKFVVTLDVLRDKDHIHAGFYPNGIGDLDGDGDKDLVLPDRWMENVKGDGKEWKKHPIPFGKRGPYGLSARSWIVDLDQDGDNDIVMTDCDQQASRAAWLENNGEVSPTFTAHFLPMTATGIRGSFHSLFVGDFDDDGDLDIFTCDQEDRTLLPEGASPRWYIWENIGGNGVVKFEERVILDKRLGGHDALVLDVDGDGDLDILSKVWNLWPDNANKGLEHVDYLENKHK